MAYGTYALAILALSIGIMVIVYGLGLLPFNPIHILGWLFGPLGAYTVIYAIATKRDPLYYIIWGTILLAIAMMSTLYELVNPLVILGVTILILVVAALLSRKREK